MRAAIIALVIFAVIGCSTPKPYGEQQRQCCGNFSPWAQDHMGEVRDMANKLRNEYNVQASGRSSGIYKYLVADNGFWVFLLFLLIF